MTSVQKAISILLGATAIIGTSSVALNSNNLSIIKTFGDSNKNCGAYTTNIDWNISYEEIIGLTTFEEGYKTLDEHEQSLIDCSSIIYSATSFKGQYYRREDNKEELKSLKFGTGNTAGSLSLILTKQIDAIGFYAEAYQHAKDQTDKKLLVNGVEIDQILGHTYTYDLSDQNQRFFVEFEEPTNEITIEASSASNNRFHIYSIGFYSKNNFPDAIIPANYTVSFDSNGGTGTMDSISVRENTSYELPSCAFDAPSGKTFDYWSLNGIKQTNAITITSNITLVANWKNLPAGEITSNLTFTAACGGSGTADNGIEWTVTSDAAESVYDGTKGIHYGTGKLAVEYIELRTSDISGTVTKVIVNASGASGVNGSISVTVGGQSFASNQSFNATAQNYTFNGSKTAGEIVIRIFKSAAAVKAIYCKMIEVTYNS